MLSKWLKIILNLFCRKSLTLNTKVRDFSGKEEDEEMIHVQPTEYGEYLRIVTKFPYPNGLEDYTDEELSDIIFDRQSYTGVGVDYITYMSDDDLRDAVLRGEVFSYISNGVTKFVMEDDEGGATLIVRRKDFSPEKVNEDIKRFYDLVTR